MAAAANSELDMGRRRDTAAGGTHGRLCAGVGRTQRKVVRAAEAGTCRGRHVREQTGPLLRLLWIPALPDWGQLASKGQGRRRGREAGRHGRN